MKVIVIFMLSLLWACAAVQTEPEVPEEPAVQVVDEAVETPVEEAAPVPATPTE